MTQNIDTTPYQEFAKEKLGFMFNDINLLVTALTHRSYVNEHKDTVHEHNERLEFLGDAVLELVSSDFLFRNFNEPEGVMTALRAALVRTESIGDAGHELGYGPLVRAIKEEGPDHDKMFTVGVYVGDSVKGTGTGHSKQEAQTMAAREGVKLYLKEHKDAA